MILNIFSAWGYDGTMGYTYVYIYIYTHIYIYTYIIHLDNCGHDRTLRCQVVSRK